MTNRTTWRGVTLDTRTAAQCAELAAIIGDDITVTPTQGSYRPRTRYSAGTHCGGGAVDISVRPLTAAQEKRLVIAADAVGMCGWIRPAIPDLWVRHFHALSIPPNLKGPGVLDPSAWDQILAARRGLDGLASAGPDPHRSLRTWTTWETYRKDTLTMADITKIMARLDRIEAIATANQKRIDATPRNVVDAILAIKWGDKSNNLNRLLTRARTYLDRQGIK